MGASPDGEPTGCGENLAMTLVLPQPERRGHAAATCGSKSTRNQKIEQDRVSGVFLVNRDTAIQQDPLSDGFFSVLYL